MDSSAADVFKYLSDDDLLNLSIRIINRGLLASVTFARYESTFYIWQTIKGLK